MSELPTQLTRLWRLAGGNPLDVKADWNSTFDPIGLILVAPPRNGGYWCTPVNSVSFATTGGDGVHYSWIVLPEVAPDFSPIVMTVPMCDTPNVIVGRNFHDFLALGCKYGNFSLEQLVYQPNETVAELAAGRVNPEWDVIERALVSRLTSEFDLRPWRDPAGRLEDLRREFQSLLVLPEPADVAEQIAGAEP